MKNYNKILEAINRGIQLALDDFEEAEVQNIKSKQIQNKDYTKEYIDLMEEAIDLGLPSGTLWGKYNLGVDQNQLFKASDWYGDYYAWGELEPNKTNKRGKFYFDWSNYKYGKDHNALTKYCNMSKNGLNGFTDNLSELLPEDDAAYQNKKFHNYKFHIPSKEQFEELLNYTKNYWVNNYDPNKTIHNPKDDGGIQGLNGRVFEGKNENQLFIPAAGYCDGTVIYNVGYSCFTWSSSLCLLFPFCVYYMNFDSDSINVYGNSRHYGYNVRPVIKL